MPSYSPRNSESCIPEDLGSPSDLCVPSEARVQAQPGSPEHSTLTEEMVFSQELESTSLSFHRVLDLPSGVPGISLIPPHTGAIEMYNDISHVPQVFLTLGKTSLVP